MKSALCLVFCCFLLTACRHVEQGRFLADARINDKPVCMAYDTGAEGSIIFERQAKRLGLKGLVPPPSGRPEPGKVKLGQTGFINFKVGSETSNVKLATLHLPWWWGGLDVSGVIGWPDMMDDLIAIDATTASIKGLDKLPEGAAGWLRLPLYPHTGVLALEIPRADGKIGVVEVDTGNPEGVSLSAERWREWRAAHPHAHGGWTMDIMPGSGLVLGRKFIADDLALGPLTLRNVPLRKANQSEKAIAGNAGVFEAAIGFKALQRMNFIVDQKNHVAYLQPRPMLLATNDHPRVKAPRQAVAMTNSTVHLRFHEHEILDHANAAFDSGKYEEAVMGYTRFLEMAPGNAQAYTLCGEARYHLAAAEGSATNFARAINDLDRALELNSGIERAYFVRGSTHYLAQQLDDALKDYRRFCELDPADGSYARFYIWLIRAGAKQQSAAADQELGEYFTPGHKMLGGVWQAKIAALLLGRLGETDFLRAVHPGDTGQQCEAWYYAGVKRRLSGDRATAKDYFQRCLATAQKDYYEYNFAVAELKALK